MHVRVETQGVRTVGRTVMDTRTHDSEPPNARVAFDADARRFVELMTSTFGPQLDADTPTTRERGD
jgi:inosine-uridine nucleoside N-ribohydrolase